MSKRPNLGCVLAVGVAVALILLPVHVVAGEYEAGARGSLYLEENESEVQPAAGYEGRAYGEWVWTPEYGTVWRPWVSSARRPDYYDYYYADYYYPYYGYGRWGRHPYGGAGIPYGYWGGWHGRGYGGHYGGFRGHGGEFRGHGGEFRGHGGGFAGHGRGFGGHGSGFGGHGRGFGGHGGRGGAHR